MPRGRDFPRGVKKIHIHVGLNAPLNEDNLECALFTQTGPPRKLFASMAVMTSMLGANPVPAGEKHFGDSAHVVTFTTGEDAVAMVWQDERGSRTMELDTPVETEVTDAMGRTISRASDFG